MALTLRQYAGIAQWLVHQLAMLGMAVRFCLPALLLGNGVMVTYNSLKVVFLVRVQVSQLIFNGE